MHYAFDLWMDREFPGYPFERYADDIVAHCDTEDQARNSGPPSPRDSGPSVWNSTEKTKVVHCKDTNRRRDSEQTSFDFLGYTFRGRTVLGSPRACSLASTLP